MVADRGYPGVRDALGSREVRLAGTERDDVLALGLERVGARGDREGDRLFVGAAETVRFCRSAAKQTVAAAFEQKGVELASVSQQQVGESIN